MDKQVQLAMAKWPNVPHCYGWLGLDARGQWRMRDQRTQDMGGLGSKISHAALCGFINRNYCADQQGCYFFQNGPQRVFVELQATPYIAHFDPAAGWTLHTGVALHLCDSVGMTDEGNLIFESGHYLAQLDDRDLAVAMSQVCCHGQTAGDETILAWLTEAVGHLTFLFDGQHVPIRRVSLIELAASVPFVPSPARLRERAGTPAP